MNIIINFLNSLLFELFILPFITAFGLTLVGRYTGREFEKCNNWKERIQVWILIFISTFINYVLIMLLITIAFFRGKYCN